MAQQPWQVGPSPSASRAEKGLAFTGHAGVQGDFAASRGTIAFSPHKRIWASAELGTGAGFRTCPTCSDVGFTGTARVLVIDGSVIRAAAWGSGTADTRDRRWMAGVAAEAQVGRLSIDTSWPVWISEDPWDTILDAPELGARWDWSKRNSTRVAVVGLDPDLALTHRLDLGLFGIEGTARTLDDGIFIEAGVRLQL